MTNAGGGKEKGVMLLEALIGLLIFSLGILALLGMQGLAMRATMDAKYRSEAGFLANEVIGMMWVDRGVDLANLNSYATADCAEYAPCQAWLTRVAQLLPQTDVNAPTIAISGQQVTVTVRWQRPGETTVSNHVAVATINDT